MLSLAQVDLTPYAQFGLAGVVIAWLFWYILQRDKVAEKERTDTRADIKALSAKHDENLRVISEKHDATVKEISDRFANLHEKTLIVVAKMEVRRKDE